ncbi:MAG: translesion DNA synthesis-associated protein ImuA [Lysobacterales bacterium]|jgi:cell division inhibitor SulA/protein ImuA
MASRLTIDTLLDSTPRLWKGRQANRAQRALPTGQARLDARLPGGGWPLGAVSEVIAGHPGLGELSLVLPALADIGGRGQWLVLVDPPWIPYPASLAGNGLPLERLLLIRTKSQEESLWACEQALANGRGGAVLAWPERVAFPRLRRLQLAAEANGKLAVLFRPEGALREPSPAALRLLLEAGGPGRVRLQIVKCRGSRPSEPMWISMARASGAEAGAWPVVDERSPDAPPIHATGHTALPAGALLN